MGRTALLALATAMLIVGLAFADATMELPRPPAPAPRDPGPTNHQVSTVTIEAHDGVALVATLFRPAGSSPSAPVPLVLHGHGWAGSRIELRTPTIDGLLDAGYGVLSMDFRGHGDSGGLAQLHDPEHEVRDVSTILDWAHAELDWVVRQDAADGGHERDLLVGAMGGSYGGAYQLLVAALDGRVDVLVPEITWSDLSEALAPNGALKSAWLGVLYGAAKANARPAPVLDEGFAEASATNELPARFAERLAASSPTNYPGSVTAPTLLVQGVVDTLFNLNQAVWTLELVVADGTDARLFTHLDGHVLHPSAASGEAPPALPGLQPPPRGSPCADVDALRLAWFDEHLKGIEGAAADIPTVTLALDDAATCLTADGWPLVEDPTELRLGAPVALNQGVAGPSVLVPLATVDRPRALAGIPTLAGTITTPARATVYASLAVVEPSGAMRVVDDQVTPLRVAGPVTANSFAIELGGVGGALEAGDELALKLDVLNEQFAANSERTPGGVVLRDLVVGLPLVDL